MTIQNLMLEVIALAKDAIAAGEDPFAALLVNPAGEVVARTIDRSIAYSDPTAHAELVLISEYCRVQELIDLEGYSLYTFVEPCVMCSGAIHWAKISRLIFCLSQTDLKRKSGGNPKPASTDLVNIGGKKVEVIGGVCQAEGLLVLDGLQWRSKKERHQAFYAKK